MDERLQAELLARATADQSAFAELDAATTASDQLALAVADRSDPTTSTPAWIVEWTDAPPEAIVHIQAIVRQNARWMQGVVRHYGWPGRSIVGDEGAAASWLLVHHADDLSFQRECLPLLENAVERGEAEQSQLEWLTDRVLLREGKPEKFGTHGSLDELGAERGRVELRPYSPRWAALGNAECERLTRLLQGHAIDIQHVGSTSVPGLDAKPILDIAVAISSDADRRELQQRLEEDGGYEFSGDKGAGPGLLFVKATGNVRLVHVHVVEIHSAAWSNYLLFRDHLRSHPERAEAYGRLKGELADRFHDDRASYTFAKAAFIEETIKIVAEGGPPTPVASAFGLEGTPERLEGGEGTTWLIGDVVLKRVGLSEQIAWEAEVFASIADDAFRFPRPHAAEDGSLVVGVWAAWDRVEGRHEPRRWPEIIAVGEAFHAALAGVARPNFFDSRTDPWSIGDRVAWGELPSEEFARVKHLSRLVAALRPIDAPNQLIHGDLTGNVLFAEGLPPAIIDFSPYWRPVAFASAIVVADAFVWEEADESVLDAVAHVERFDQFLLRALIYRAVTDRLFREDDPIRPDDDDPYLPVVDLALRLARAQE